MQTTGWTLTLATFHLLESPSILSKLKTELKTVDPDSCAQRSIPVLKRSYFMAIIVEASPLEQPTVYNESSNILSPLSPLKKAKDHGPYLLEHQQAFLFGTCIKIRISFQTHGLSSQSGGSKPLIR